MPSSNQATGRPYWSSGRGFASMDPERQGEVLGYVRNSAIESSPKQPTERSTQRGWMRVQPDVESGFEGSSSRRWR